MVNMKKIILPLLLFLSINSFAQTKDSTVEISDTTKILSVTDINRIASTLKTKVTAQQYEDISMIMRYIIETEIKELKDKK